VSLALTNLDIATLSIGGNSYLRNAEGVSLDMNFNLAAAHGIDMRHMHEVATKRRNTFSVPMFRFTSARPRTNLDFTVFDFASAQLLGSLKSGAITITTQTEDGSGLADPYTFPIPVATEVELRGSLLCRGTPDNAILDAAADGALTALEVTMAVTASSVAFAMPMVVSSVAHNKQRGAIEKYDLVMRPQAAHTSSYGITQNFAGVPLLQSILTGTAFAAFTIGTTGGITYTGNAIVTSGEMSWQDAAVISDRFEFEVQGALSAALTT